MLAIVSAVVFAIFYVFPSADPATLRAELDLGHAVDVPGPVDALPAHRGA